jgi:hypothetical protein
MRCLDVNEDFPVPGSFETIVPLIRFLLADGVDRANVSHLAKTHGWKLLEELGTCTLYDVSPDFSLFVTSDDPSMTDHCCILRWLNDADRAELANRVEAEFSAGFAVLTRHFGKAAAVGEWPASEVDCFPVRYRYAIWRLAEMMLILQVDDIDPQSGVDVDVIVQARGVDREFPSTRRWRYR